jgi:hypothetical protein
MTGISKSTLYRRKKEAEADLINVKDQEEDLQ